MLFMVVEHFAAGRVRELYGRAAERGRLLPDGVTYLDSWVAADLSRCFQLMETDDVSRLQTWVAAWEDLARFEIVPVARSADTAAALADRACPPTAPSGATSVK